MGDQPTGRLIGYARVSTEDQNTDAQLDALRQAGCVEIFKEHRSGADRARPELARAIAATKPLRSTHETSRTKSGFKSATSAPFRWLPASVGRLARNRNGPAQTISRYNLVVQAS